MKLQSILAAIVALSSSVLAATPTSFTVTALSREPAINGVTMHAVYGYLIFNVDTRSSCKAEAVCPDAKDTIFTTSGDGRLYLNTQPVFANQIDGTSNSGLLGFYAAGSDDGIARNGRSYSGFTLDDGFLKSPGGDFVACISRSNIYAVFIGGGGDGSDCVNFMAQYSSVGGDPNLDYPANPPSD